MENSIFHVILDVVDDIIRVSTKLNIGPKVSYVNEFDNIWIKQRGLVFVKENLLTFVGSSMVTIELFNEEVAIRLYELRSEGHYIFSTSIRHIHFHIEGATRLACENIVIEEHMTIDEIQCRVKSFQNLTPLFFISGLIL